MSWENIAKMNELVERLNATIKELEARIKVLERQNTYLKITPSHWQDHDPTDQ